MRDLARFLPSKRNAIALAAGFLLTFAAWWWMTRDRAPQRAVPVVETPSQLNELDKIENAVAKARSWHSTVFGTTHGQAFQEDRDVVCPSETHSITRTAAKDGGMELAQETVETGGTIYMREAHGPWVSQPGSGANYCEEGPMAGPAPLISTLRRLKATATPRRSELFQVEGRTCRVWQLLAGGSEAGLICADEETHLPLELRAGALRVQYSNWNLPAIIVAPRKEIP